MIKTLFKIAADAFKQINSQKYPREAKTLYSLFKQCNEKDADEFDENKLLKPDWK
jgi:acyl-CoA-binding protein